MFYLAMGVPFAAIAAFVFADLRESAPFVVMAVLGFVNFAISHRLFGLIQTDVGTLAVAVSPQQESNLSTSGSTTGSHSFRSGK
jgi:hypothetical protein